MKGFAIIKYVLIFSFVMSACMSNAQEENTTSYYFIRHAEKDRSDNTNKDPNLVDKGRLRALNWSIILKDIKFDAIYSTNYNRTKQTAIPTSQSQNIEVQIYDPRDMYNEAFRKETKGKTVLIVGHSNTTPIFVNKVLGEEKYQSINDANNGNLYVVTMVGAKKTVQLFHFD